MSRPQGVVRSCPASEPFRKLAESLDTVRDDNPNVGQPPGIIRSNKDQFQAELMKLIENARKFQHDWFGYEPLGEVTE